MQNEPNIEQLEKLIAAFRQQGGSDAELSLLAQDILHEYLPQKRRALEEIFPKEHHPTIAKIKEFQAGPEHPLKEAIRVTWRKKKVKYPVILVSLFAVIFFVLNLPFFIARFQPVETAKTYEKVKEVIRPVTDTSAPLEPGEVVPSGSHLVVPKLGVNAPIIFSNSFSESVIQEELKLGVVHYKNTAIPGTVGNAFITGHSSNYWWNSGKYNYIFANLSRMKVGDQAKIYHGGNKYLYQVTESRVVEPTDTSVLSGSDTPTLTLMTCTPPGTSWKRLIVKFDQVSPVYAKPIVVEKYQEVPGLDKLPTPNSNIFLDWIAKVFNL